MQFATDWRILQFATDWRILDNRGRPWLVCVHGYIVIFLMCGPWLKVLTKAHTHIHIKHVSLCKNTHTYTMHDVYSFMQHNLKCAINTPFVLFVFMCNFICILLPVFLYPCLSLSKYNFAVQGKFFHLKLKRTAMFSPLKQTFKSIEYTISCTGNIR